MTEEQLEGNKLIAKFMDEYDLYHWGRDPFNELLTATYHSSWNNLMPVVEKIGDIHNQADQWLLDGMKIDNLEIITTHIFCPKEIVYQRVVEFINWHNKTK